MMTRTYEQGRSTTGWRKGRRITKPMQVNPGDVLIGVSHQFRSENLFVAISPSNKLHQANGFGVLYVKPDLTLTDSDRQPQWVWDFELMDSECEWFQARKTK